MNKHHHLQPSLSLDVYWPMMASAALIAAGELGIFVALGQGALKTEQLAIKIGASVLGTEKLCAVLVQTGYLVRTADDCLKNSPHAQAWLSQTTFKDMSSELRWYAQAWQLMCGLRDAVVNSKPQTDLWTLMQTKPEMGPAFAAFMRDYAASVVEEVQRAIVLPDGAKTLLDVGGSHGLHAAAFCRRFPELKATIFDLPVSLSNTRCLIEGWKMADRIHLVEGNILTDDVPGKFDAITYFLVAHNHSNTDNEKIIGKLAAALNPGGELFLYEYARDSSSRFTVSNTEALAAAFDLTLLVETGTSMHAADQINAWLVEAGLKNIRRTDLLPIEKGTVFSGLKAG